MSENKTKPTKVDPIEYIESLTDNSKRSDSIKLIEIMRNITGKEPIMWGKSIIGFDEYHYKYASGREGDFMAIGFSPRKNNLSIYLIYRYDDRYKDLLLQLGKYKSGKACLYIKSLDEVDLSILEQIISKSYKDIIKANL